MLYNRLLFHRFAGNCAGNEVDIQQPVTTTDTTTVPRKQYLQRRNKQAGIYGLQTAALVRKR